MTDDKGAYTITNVPVDMQIPLLDEAGSRIGCDTIGTSFWIWAVKGDQGTHDALQVTVDRNSFNTFNMQFTY